MKFQETYFESISRTSDALGLWWSKNVVKVTQFFYSVTKLYQWSIWSKYIIYAQTHCHTHKHLQFLCQETASTT